MELQSILHPAEPRKSYNAGSSYESGIIKEDTRLLRRDTSIAPFRYICRIIIRFPDGRREGVGTGFLIGRYTVLTAGHVIWDEAANGPFATGRIKVIPGLNGTQKPFGEYAVSSTIMSHASFSKSDFVTFKDYAIVHLSAPAGDKAGHFNTKVSRIDPVGSSILSKSLPLPAGTLTVNLSGYPADKGGKLQYSSYNYTKALEDKRKIITYLNDMYPGHSGSPIWVKRSPDMGGRVIVGINVGFYNDSSRNIGVLITDEVRSFLKAHVL
ncbi:MAG: trypsin-like serine protease [Williamsia sp.]|nr:trypsin-like serine protease [Williamsia sp.]